jgi:hypothetical protein
VKISRRLVADTFDLLGAMLAIDALRAKDETLKPKMPINCSFSAKRAVEVAALRNTQNF